MNNTASVYKAFLQISGCCFFMLFISAAQSSAQTTRGTVEVIKDARIDTLAARRFNAAKTGGMEVASSNGYRVQIFTGANRKDAYDAQAKFKEQYPDVHTYITYREPNFKVRAGDFRTRLEAEKMLNDLKKWFTGMFIISEKINLKIDSADE